MTPNCTTLLIRLDFETDFHFNFLLEALSEVTGQYIQVQVNSEAEELGEMCHGMPYTPKLTKKPK